MTPNDVVRELREALEKERDAICRLDAEGVEDASNTKEKIIAAVRATPSPERAALVEALTMMRAELRRNLVLLAHARDCLKGALASARTTRLSTEL